MNFWAADFWADGFWAAGFWANEAASPSNPIMLYFDWQWDKWE
jgi:hypothetical protein